MFLLVKVPAGFPVSNPGNIPGYRTHYLAHTLYLLRCKTGTLRYYSLKDWIVNFLKIILRVAHAQRTGSDPPHQLTGLIRQRRCN